LRSSCRADAKEGKNSTQYQQSPDPSHDTIRLTCHGTWYRSYQALTPEATGFSIPLSPQASTNLRCHHRSAGFVSSTQRATKKCTSVTASRTSTHLLGASGRTRVSARQTPAPVPAPHPPQYTCIRILLPNRVVLFLLGTAREEAKNQETPLLAFPGVESCGGKGSTILTPLPTSSSSSCRWR